MTFVIGLLLLCVLVVFHELGHFLAAKSFGIRVHRFSVGFGKALVEWKHGDTVYAIAAVPLGGYVKMAGENPDDDDLTGAPDEFGSKPWWQRFVVVTAGPIANLIFALVANSLIGVVGIDVPLQPTKIDTVEEAAALAGFQPGDTIQSIDAAPVETWYAMQLAVVDGDSDPLRVGILRPGEPTVTIDVPRAEALEVIGGLVPWADTSVGRVSVGMPAYQAGLRDGDRITGVDGVEVASWNAMRERISSRPGETFGLTIDRDGTSLDVTVTPMEQEDGNGAKIGLIGIEPDTATERQTAPLGQSISDGFNRTKSMAGAVYSGFWMMVSQPKTFKDNVAGPITIAQLAGSSTSPSQVLYFLAFISMALMALNLLPIPILDGGHAMFCLIEGVRGRALSLRSQLALQRVGLVMIGSLVIMAVFNDVKRVVERTQAVNRLNTQETTEER